MTRKHLALLSVALFVTAFLLALGATWWWAIAGMSQDIVVAWLITCVGLALAGTACAAASAAP